MRARAAVTAGEIAESADFFSFGTNDLTQTAFGFSRDDIGKFVGMYEERKLVPANPFVTIDRPGVGALMRIAVDEGRAANPSMHLGICGEHGGSGPARAFAASGIGHLAQQRDHAQLLHQRRIERHFVEPIEDLARPCAACPAARAD